MLCTFKRNPQPWPLALKLNDKLTVQVDQVTVASIPTIRKGFSSSGTVESTLTGIKGLIGIDDATKLEDAQRHEAEPDVHLLGCRASLGELLCSEPDVALWVFDDGDQRVPRRARRP